MVGLPFESARKLPQWFQPLFGLGLDLRIYLHAGQQLPRH